jgi:hypothetical protein
MPRANKELRKRISFFSVLRIWIRDPGWVKNQDLDPG